MSERNAREAAREKDGGITLPELGSALEFMRLLWEVDHGLQSTSKWMARSIGVTGPQRLVVRVVGRRPGVSAGELARILCVHPSTLTGVLKRLGDAGILDRKADKADARRAVLRLTAKGRRIDQHQGGTIEAAVRRVLGKVTEEQVEATRTVLKVLAAELQRPE